jgi:membrane dipeptidase
MNRPIAVSLCLALLFASQPPAIAGDADDHAARARAIAESAIIIDTHIDVPMKLLRTGADVSRPAEGFDFDYPRARAGGLNVPFMSIYTDAKLEAEGKSREMADQLIDAVEKMAATAPDKFAIARSTTDVRAHFERGLMSLPLGMENGSPIEGDLDNLRHFYDRGIRYITLAHGLSNHISDSSYDDNHQWQGLSDFGVEVVREMNRLGIMIDISHLSDDAVRQVFEISETPVIASHSSARHFTPGFERNLSDELIVGLAENGGVIQINFGSGFINSAARAYDSKRWPAGRAWLEEHPDMSYADLAEHFLPDYAAKNGPYPYASLDDVLDHFDHVVDLVGIDHVGIGSDYDGVGDSLPTGLKDVSTYPNLIEGLLARGYSEADIRKILGGNLLRVWSEVEAAAAQAATTSSST